MGEEEEEKAEENKEEEKSDAGSEDTAQRLDEATQKLEEATRRNKETLAKIAEQKAEQQLSGQAEAGVAPPKKSNEQKIKEEIHKWMPPGLMPDSLK